MPDHCSVLVKLIADTPATPTSTHFPWSELYVAHTTWSGLEDMLRVYKMYDFPFSTDGTSSASTVVPGRRLAFSSYPGNLSNTL